MTSTSGTNETPGCAHLTTVHLDPAPAAKGCVECLADGSRWVHLRLCESCGHVGCCDSSPNKHATSHARTTSHPLVRSYEPGEDWFYCYPDDLMFELADAPPAPSYR